jgi:glycosyltransferase involved in cell wall biosynthesis
MGSFKEGWSTSLAEAIACGIPSVVTDFSSAKEIIVDGRNGYVIENRSVDNFIKGMLIARDLATPVFNDNVRMYSTDKLKDDLLKLWNLI